MKKTCLYIFFLFLYVQGYGQKIQYSRQTLQTIYADVMQLVANVGGYHHFLCFTANKEPVVYIFDAQLQLQSQQKVNLKLAQNSDIRLVSFKNFYFLYVHPVNTTKHELFKITGEGKVTNLSKEFQVLIEREFGKNTSTLQLINQHEDIYVVAHTYYDAIKKIGSSVMQLDKDLNPVLIRKVLYSFNRDEELLHQATLVGSSILALKTSRNIEKGNSLDIVKADLSTGESIITTFNSASHFYLRPAFRFNEKDSTILVYSVVREPVNSARIQRTVFISRLNFALQEQSPISLLRSQFRNNTAANFLLLEGISSCWLNLNNSLRFARTPRNSSSQNFEWDDATTFNLTRTVLPASRYATEYTGPTGVRFTVLDDKLKVVNDSLVANTKKVIDVQPHPFAQFSMDNKSYLLLIQNFTSRRRGLVLLNSTEEGELTSSDIRVFDKYEYLLGQLQAVENSYVIFPYLYKSEIGLVKITIE